MRILLVGGSGRVGRMTIPYLKTKHSIRVLDIEPPIDSTLDFIKGSVTNPKIVQQALEGMDTFIYMAMKNPTSEISSVATFEDIVVNHQVNVMGVHLLLHAANEVGIERGTYTSTFTVHERTRNYFPSEDEVPLKNPSVYGLTKGIGEEICRYFCREHQMAITALRITGPSTRSQWLERRTLPKSGPVHIWWTDEEDLANAYLAALSCNHPGFEAFFIAGDEEQKEINLSKAGRLLGWQPLTHNQL